MSKDTIVTEWFEQYSDDIYNFIVYKMGTSDVEDLVQEVFIRAFKKYETFQSRSSPKTWLMTIARNVTIDEIRRMNRPFWKQRITLEITPEPREKKTPENIVELNENHNELYWAIQELKDNYRDVIILRSIEECSILETAKILKWSESKVRSTYYRACKCLQNKLGGVKIEK